MSGPPNQPLEGIEADGAKNIPRPPVSHLAPGDAPSVHPAFTRKEAWELGGKHHRLPMTEEIAGGIAARVIQGVPAKQIAEEFGYSKHNASELPKHPAVKRHVIHELHEAGADPAFVAKKAKELLDAKTTKFFADKGIVTDERDVTDNATQLGTLRTVLEAYGVLGQSPAKSAGGEGVPRLVIVNAEEAVFFGEPMSRRPDGEGGP